MAQKKSFKDNPALQFITTTPHKEKTATLSQPATSNVETKSKRLNLLIRPSLHTKLTNMAQLQDISVNALIHKALYDFLEREEK